MNFQNAVITDPLHAACIIETSAALSLLQKMGDKAIVVSMLMPCEGTLQ